MINPIEWFKEKGFTFDDKITIADVIALQEDARKAGSWIPVTADLPDGEMVVLASHPEWSDPVWPAFIECDLWHWADGSPCEPQPLAWRDFPETFKP